MMEIKSGDLQFGAIRERRDGVLHYRTYVDGKWTFSADGKFTDVTNPATGELVARVPQLNADEVHRAIDAAAASKRKIRDIPAIERTEILHRAQAILEANREVFIRTLVEESGKPVSVARGEVTATIERLHLTLEEARALHGDYIPGDWVKDTTGKFAIVRRDPRGVIACISPFNYPLFIAVAKIVPALVAGNTVVAKPATATPVALLLFVRALELAGLPEGCVNVVTGRGSEVGDLLAESPKIDMVTFTGSTPVGEHLSKKAGMKKLHLELGGKGAALVLDDANLDVAAKEVAYGGLKFAGQRCDATDRVMVHPDVADDFLAKLVDVVKKDYKMGDPSSDDTAVGPLISESAAEYVAELVKDAVDKGAKLVLGGGREGTFHEPTILDGVTPEMRVAWEESFGPVIPVMRVESIDEMIDLVNQSEFGLDSAVFTQDLYKAIGVAKRLEEGEVTINGHPSHGVGHFPFGGNKKSGLGREGIGASIDEMTRMQTIVFNLPPMQAPYGW